LSLRRSTNAAALHGHLPRNKNGSSSSPFATQGRRYTHTIRPLPGQLNRAPPAAPKHNFPQGSLQYVSPELLQPTYAPKSSRKLVSSGSNPAQDIWALGVMLYVLLSGTFPFNDSFEPRLVDKIVRGFFKMPTNIGARAEEVLNGCLETEYQNRWDVVRVDECAWGVGWEEINSAHGSGNGTPVHATRSTASLNENGRQNGAKRLSPLSRASMIDSIPLVDEEDEEEEDEELTRRGRNTQPVARYQQSQPRHSFASSESRSQSRSQSRPPGLAGGTAVRAPVLEPIMTRVSITGAGGRSRTSSVDESRSPETPRDLSRDSLRRGRGKIGHAFGVLPPLVTPQESRAEDDGC